MSFSMAAARRLSSLTDDLNTFCTILYWRRVWHQSSTLAVMVVVFVAVGGGGCVILSHSTSHQFSLYIEKHICMTTPTFEVHATTPSRKKQAVGDLCWSSSFRSPLVFSIEIWEYIKLKQQRLCCPNTTATTRELIDWLSEWVSEWERKSGYLSMSLSFLLYPWALQEERQKKGYYNLQMKTISSSPLCSSMLWILSHTLRSS